MSKPWLRTQTNQSSSNELLAAMDAQKSGLESAPVDQQTANAMTDPTNPEAADLTTGAVTGTTTTTSPALGTTSSYSPYSSGMYGGYGGGLGGYGMYGGLGMGMGMGMYGMDQNSSFFKSMQAMQSLSMVVGSMVQVVGSLEQNTQGLVFLYQCVKKLINRISSSIVGAGVWLKNKFLKLVYNLMVLLRLAKKDEKEDDESAEGSVDIEGIEIAMDDQDKKDLERLRKMKKRKRIYGFLMKVATGLVLLSCYYFYVVGRSFKVDFFNVRSGQEAVEASGDGFGADEFDKMMNE